MPPTLRGEIVFHQGEKLGQCFGEHVYTYRWFESESAPGAPVFETKFVANDLEGIDKFKVFDRALAPEEILDHYIDSKVVEVKIVGLDKLREQFEEASERARRRMQEYLDRGRHLKE